MVGAKGRVLRSGGYVGEDFLRAGARHSGRATAMTFADMQTLSRDRLFTILDAGEFPETSRTIQVAALRAQLREHMRELVKSIKAAQLFSGGPKMSREEMQAWKRQMAEKCSAAKHDESQRLAEQLADISGVLQLSIVGTTGLAALASGGAHVQLRLGEVAQRSGALALDAGDDGSSSGGVGEAVATQLRFPFKRYGEMTARALQLQVVESDGGRAICSASLPLSVVNPRMTRSRHDVPLAATRPCRHAPTLVVELQALTHAREKELELQRAERKQQARLEADKQRLKSPKLRRKSRKKKRPAVIDEILQKQGPPEVPRPTPPPCPTPETARRSWHGGCRHDMTAA